MLGLVGKKHTHTHTSAHRHTQVEWFTRDDIPQTKKVNSSEPARPTLRRKRK